jgi:hypothetical protein
MKRREFITLLGSATAAWPLAARAQSAEHVRRIGVLANFAESDAETQAMIGVLQRRLSELGWNIDRHSGRKYSRRPWQWHYGRQYRRSDTRSRRVRSDTHPRLQRSGAFSHDFRHGQWLCIARRQRHCGQQDAAGDNGEFHHSRFVGLTTLSLSPSRSAQLHTA